MTSPSIHVFFAPGQGQIVVALAAREIGAAYGVVVSGAARPAGELVAAMFPPASISSLYCFDHDFQASPAPCVEVYGLSPRGEPRLILASTYEDDDGEGARPPRGSDENGSHSRWTALAIGFQAARRNDRPLFAAYHRAIAVPNSEIPLAPVDLGEILTRKLEVSAPSRAFTPLFVWAARERGDPGGPIRRAGPMTLVKPVGSAPLEGELRAFLEWETPPRSQEGAASALAAAIHRRERPAAVFRLELDDVGSAREIVSAAAMSSVRLAHVSLKRAGAAAALRRYRRDRAQERTYTIERADPDRAGGPHSAGRAPVSLMGGSLVDGAGQPAMEIVVGEPGLGDLFVLFWRPHLIALTAPDAPRFEGHPAEKSEAPPARGGNGKDQPPRPIEELWFIAAGAHLLLIDRDSEAVATALGVSSLIGQARQAVGNVFRGPSAFGDDARRLQAKFVARATESADPSTAAAFERAGSGLGDMLRAQSLATIIREIAVREGAAEHLSAAEQPVLACFGRTPGLVAVAGAAGLLEDADAAALLRLYGTRRVESGAFPPACWLALLGAPASEAARLARSPPAEQFSRLVSLLRDTRPPSGDDRAPVWP